MNPDTRDIIDKLLQVDPRNRLGIKGGFEVLKEHDYFREIDFDNLHETPPLIDLPEVRDGEEENFESFVFVNQRDSIKQAETKGDIMC